MNGRQLAVIDGLVAEGAVVHVSPSATAPAREPVRQVYQMWAVAFPDWHTSIEDLWADGDTVVLRVTESGTQTGEVMGIAPTVTRSASVALSISRCVDGQVVEVWAVANTLSMFAQLGAMPTLGQATAYPLRALAGSPSRLRERPKIDPSRNHPNELRACLIPAPYILDSLRMLVCRRCRGVVAACTRYEGIARWEPRRSDGGVCDSGGPV